MNKICSSLAFTIHVAGISIIVGMLMPCASRSVAAEFQVEDFQDGTVGSWSGAGGRITNQPNGREGPEDRFLQVVSDGFGGPGSRLATRNDSAAWTGDYGSLGVEGIAFDLFNSTASSPLELRLVLWGPTRVTAWTSTTAMDVPNDGAWHSYTFPVAAEDFTRVNGTTSFESVFADVGRFQIRHDSGSPSSQFSVETVSATVGFDNIRFLLPSLIDPDFNDDAIVDGTDIDALVAEIAGITHNPDFDLTGDGNVDQDDLQDWLTQAGAANLPSGDAYLTADANLDGFVDGSDFNRWNANKFTTTAAWTGGDFNADGNVNELDLTLWQQNQFMASASNLAAVPEPSTYSVVSCGMLMLLWWSRSLREKW